MNPKLRAAAIRAARTFGQAFIGSLGAAWLASRNISASGLVHSVRVTADVAAGTGILAAATALGMNFARPVTPETKT